MRVSCSIDRDLYDFLANARLSPSAVLEKATRNLMIQRETEAVARVVVEARPEDDAGPRGTEEAASYGQWYAVNERIAKAIAPQGRFKLWREETKDGPGGQ